MFLRFSRAVRVCGLLRVRFGLVAKELREQSLEASALKEGDKQICAAFAPGIFKRTESKCF